MKYLLLTVALFFAITAFAQSNFTYTPEKPKPGDEIKFTYTPSGDLTGVAAMPEAYAVVFKNSGMEMVDVPLEREYGKLVGSLNTDTSIHALAFGFTADGKFDNNSNNGFIIQLTDADGHPLAAGYKAVADIYSYLGEWKLGMQTDRKKAISAYEALLKLHPDQKEKYTEAYLRELYSDDKEKGTTAVQREIENTLKDSLKEEKDYTKLMNLYNILRLRQQVIFIKNLRDEKFPQKAKVPGINEFHAKFTIEKDNAQKEQVLSEVIQASKAADNKDEYTSFINYLQRTIASAYVSGKDWGGFKKMTARITEEKTKASLYNSAARKMQQDSTNLKLAEEISRYAVTYANADWKKPKGEKPKMQRHSEWMAQKQSDYGTYADTYAMVLYRMGNYKKAMSYAKEAQAVTKGESVDNNTTFALIAEKALKPGEYKPLLEQFVKDGKSNIRINDILKRLYVNQHKNESGFEEYIATLEKEAYLKLVADLRKEMLSEPAPQFALKDLSGNTVNIADMKGKIVVVDFWATWCGPCIASMPGMQKMVNKYKDNPGVKFLFIDTWQNEDNETELVQKFIENRGYQGFHVLMDLDDKVVTSFKVEGIPTKFILGKDGNIKFKDVGFGGEETLLKKLSAMIDLAN